ncbi:energy-coupling factor transporter transmembrane component T [Pseudoramibacter faecis]|uniref:energy-coupling factor transporter transmembrane component T n=1 Tax=Pseudoramibacter faecis TaxID=3108534 RepID=UPI002E78BFB9|nr:energy-coupling factor transporter transmembrane component T [Pseudoramibacter sp. HA2172]
MKLDVRYKFLLLILISIVAFSAKDIIYGSIVFIIVCLLSFLLGQRKKTIKFTAAYVLLLLFIIFSKYMPAVLSSMILMIVLCIRMCMPVMLYGQTFLKTTAVSEMVTGLYAMKIPRAFIITFAVAMRFFPTAKEEISHVRDAMSLRGIGFSLRNLRLRPALVFEGFMAPLLVRASTIAEELSAASITRGLDNPAPRTSFIKLGITFKDTFLTFIFAAMLVSVLLMRTIVGR